MRFNLKIKGIGQSVPENKLTNKDIESITPNSKAKWIYDKLGIKERRIATNNDNVVTLGTNASREALNDSNLTAQNLDLIIVNTSSADKISPSVACMVQKELGATCPAFDINAVCSGFIYSLEIVSHLLEKYNNILMVSTETYSKITDWENRNSCFFGDGAAALIVSKSNKSNLEIILGADGKGWEHFNCDRNSKFNMNSKEVYKFGVTTLPREINTLLGQLNLDIRQIDYIIPHQPSHNVLKETARLLNLPESKICFNMINYGNTAGASIPMALYKLIKENKITNNNNLLLAAIGSGWTYGVGILKLDYK
jgi:3-oxoacyl-[acyl-carrier-protein] synthase III